MATTETRVPVERIDRIETNRVVVDRSNDTRVLLWTIIALAVIAGLAYAAYSFYRNGDYISDQDQAGNPPAVQSQTNAPSTSSMAPSSDTTTTTSPAPTVAPSTEQPTTAPSQQ